MIFSLILALGPLDLPDLHGFYKWFFDALDVDAFCASGGHFSSGCWVA